MADRRDRSRTPPLDAHKAGDNKAWSNIGVKMFITVPTYVSLSHFHMGSLSFDNRSIVGRAGPAAGPALGVGAGPPAVEAAAAGPAVEEAAAGPAVEAAAAEPNGSEADAGAGTNGPEGPTAPAVVEGAHGQEAAARPSARPDRTRARLAAPRFASAQLGCSKI